MESRGAEIGLILARAEGLLYCAAVVGDLIGVGTYGDGVWDGTIIRIYLKNI